MSDPLETIDEVEDWETSPDPDVVKTARTSAKRRHTIEVNQLTAEVNQSGDVDSVKLQRKIVVRDYNDLERKHNRYIEVAGKKEDPVEIQWLSDVTKQHSAALELTEGYITSLKADGATHKTSGSRSSSRSSASQALARLQQAERLEKEAELKLIQAKNASAKEREEELMLFQIKADREARALADQLEQNRLTSSILRKQLAAGTEDQCAITPDSDVILTKAIVHQADHSSSVPGLPQQPLQLGPSVSANQLRHSIVSTPINPSRPFSLSMRNLAAKALNAFTPSRRVTNYPQSNSLINVVPTSTIHPSQITASVVTAVNQVVTGVTPVTSQNIFNPNAAQFIPRSTNSLTGRQPVTSYVSTTVPLMAPIQSTGRQPTGLTSSATYTVPSMNPTITSTGQNHLSSFQSHPSWPVEDYMNRHQLDHGASVNSTQLYSPDEWIHSLGTMGEMVSPRSPFMRPPKTDMPKFNGDPRYWPMFSQSFKIQVHDLFPNDDAIRLTHLRNCLTENVRKQLGEALLNPMLYSYALKELYRKFGNPQIVSQACTSDLLELQPFKDEDYDALRSFSATLHSVVATLQLGGYTSELCSNSTLLLLVSKLPPRLKSRWGEKSWELTGACHNALPTVLDFDTWLDNVSMAEYSLRAGLAKPKNQMKTQQQQQSNSRPQQQQHKTQQQQHWKNGPVQNGYRVNATAAVPCPCCKASHKLASCGKFKGLTVEKRSEIAKESRVCFRCLSSEHLSPACDRSVTCTVTGCKGLHHPMLHGAPRMFPKSGATGGRASFATKAKEPTKEKETDDTEEHFSGSTAGSSSSAVLLPIVPVTIEANGKLVKTFALLDAGSELTLVVKSLAEKVELKGPSKNILITTINGTKSMRQQSVSFRIASDDGLCKFEMEEVRTVDTLNLTNRPTNMDEMRKNWPHLADIPVQTCKLEEVGLLIGMDHPAPAEIYETRKDPYDQKAPRALSTPLGWVIVGPAGGRSSTFSCNRTTVGDAKLDGVVKDFFDADTFGVKAGVRAPISADEKRALKILEENTRFNGQRYETSMLFKTENLNLPNNYKLAESRFYKLEKRLMADPPLSEKYIKAMTEYIIRNHAHKLTSEEIAAGEPGRVNYCPHHAAFHPRKPDKPRVVFDASAKCGGRSLNDELLRGPDFISNLPGALLRFRLFAVAVVADIEKMFNQVQVRQRDRSLLRFLWRTPGSNEPLEQYQMDVQIFGAISSPAVVAYVLRQCAIDSRDEKVLNEIMNHFYVDNWLVSYPLESEASSMAKRMISALKRGGFKLTQFLSSHSSVLKSVPKANLLNPTIDMDLDETPIERTLGLSYNCKDDAFELSVKFPPEILNVITKRTMLRAVSSYFDPLGFLSVVTFQAKCLLQDVWGTSAAWDDPVEPALCERWRNWVNSLSSLKALKLRRCIVKDPSRLISAKLCVFADASELGFGAVAYVRLEYQDGIDVIFLMSKVRVAPLKHKTIPRLELCAAVMAVRLALLIIKELAAGGFVFNDVIYFSDSTTVLRWISSLVCKFHAYVGNRVGEILDSSEPSQWRYVPSAENPADDCSRGINAAELTAEHRWFNGPAFLKLQESDWPKLPFLPATDSSDPEVKSTNWIGHIRTMPLPLDSLDRLVLKDTSRLFSLTRTVGFVLRAVHNFKALVKAKRLERRIGPFSGEEMRDARMFLIRRAQEKVYSEEFEALRQGKELDKTSTLITLSPFIDRHGVLCVGGRIGKASLPFDVRHPVILPPKERITALLVLQIHCDAAHPSVYRTHVQVRRRYWVPKGQITIRAILNKCAFCKLKKRKVVPPRMADMPAFRLEPGLPAFARTGVDYFGPIEVTIFRRKVKRWGCLFTCLSTRAVWIEMAYSMSTDSFLMCVDRFESIFGCPGAYYSDNGTNFEGAANELAKCLQNFDQEKIVSSMARREIEWHFNPPAAPHFGGAWESLVKSAKRALENVLHGCSLTDETLTTALAKVSNLLNNRPLTHLGVDPTDPEPLTPFHLLLGRANPNVAPDLFDRSDLFGRKKWRMVNALVDQFWQRWMEEFAPYLIARPKWCKSQRNLRVGDVVLLIDSKNARGTWPLGLVTKVCPGSDGTVRSVFIRTGNTELQRPVIKLCLLEPSAWEDWEEPKEKEGVPSPAVPRAGDVRE